MSKVYDCFMYNGEEDILEIRLNILEPYVDYFVLCESTETFSGKDKPLYFKQNAEKFSKWKDKIMHLIVTCKDQFENAFERAAWQKDSIREWLDDMKLNDEDIVYYGDVDEIWKPQEVGEKVYKLRQKCYSYYLNMRSSEDWQGTNVCKYKNLYDLNELRANHDVVLEDGGWHFTNMGGVEQLTKKLESYDHQEYNTSDIKSRLAERIENGEDYVGRKVDWKGNPFHMWIEESQLPDYLIKNKDKWIKLFQS